MHMTANEMPLTFDFVRERDGRYKVKSPGVRGLFLASKDLPALWRDLQIAIRDLLAFNDEIYVDEIKWAPSVAEAYAKVEALSPVKDPQAVTETCMVTLKAA